VSVTRLRALKGDITRLEVDAIVNAANSSLLGGSGVDGAIHRAAGPELANTCRLLNGCKTGEAKITPGFRLLARHVIHTVGPVWQGGTRGEADLLASCYRTAIEVAEDAGARSVAFPCISTGIYGFPAEPAADIAVRVVRAAVVRSPIEDVIFCCFTDSDLALYKARLAAPDA
jgi:O-acetyl-ADP-ribose deacetylase